MTRVLGLCAVAFSLVLGLAGQGVASVTVPAGAIALAPNASYTFSDGLQITVNSVSYDSATYSSANGTFCGNQISGGSNACYLYMLPQSGPNPSLIVEAALSNGTLTPLVSYACNSSDGNYAGGFCSGVSYDLALQLTVKTLTGGTYLTSASAQISGSAPSGYAADVDDSETLSVATTGGTDCASSDLNVNLNDTPGSCSFAKTNSLQLTKDAGAGGGLLYQGTYTLSTITEGFSVVPEPASTASLISGLVVLAAMRRGRRRRA